MADTAKHKWTINHSKAYIALSMCISDGVINNLEKSRLRDCMADWMPDHSDQDFQQVVASVVKRMSKSNGGVDLLAGVQKTSSMVAKGLEGDKKKMFRFLKQLKAIAEADASIRSVSDSEARVLRYVSNALGFGKKLSIRLADGELNLVRN